MRGGASRGRGFESERASTRQRRSFSPAGRSGPPGAARGFSCFSWQQASRGAPPASPGRRSAGSRRPLPTSCPCPPPQAPFFRCTISDTLNTKLVQAVYAFASSRTFPVLRTPPPSPTSTAAERRIRNTRPRAFLVVAPEKLTSPRSPGPSTFWTLLEVIRLSKGGACADSVKVARRGAGRERR